MSWVGRLLAALLVAVPLAAQSAAEYQRPQRFLPNIFDARASDFTAQEHRVWYTSQYPSHVSVTVLPVAPHAVGALQRTRNAVTRRLSAAVT